MKKNLLLYLISRFFEKLLSGLFFWWGVVRSLCVGKLSEFLLENAIQNDVDLHVVGQYFFNDTMHVSGPKAGNRLQTISCWMGIATLNKWGRGWISWLNRRDKDHCAKAVQSHKLRIEKEFKELQ